MFPTIRFTEEEILRPGFNQDTLQKAHDLFIVNGCLLLENAFDAGLIAHLHAEFLNQYSSYFVDRIFSDALKVGDKRFMITVEIDGSFNHPSVYAPPLVYPLIQTLLGSHFSLNSFGSVVSLPGSANQHIHRDHGPLFNDHKVDAIMPPFAITAIVPLVAMNEMTGTTRMYPGSHRVPPQVAEKMPFLDPYAPVGSCLLMDYTLFHRGMENRSTQVRPIMYNIYSRSWFRDYYNYNLQSPLMIKESAYQNIPECYRHLFSAVFHNIAPVNKKDVGRNDPCPCQSGKKFKHCHGKLNS